MEKEVGNLINLKTKMRNYVIYMHMYLEKKYY